MVLKPLFLEFHMTTGSVISKNFHKNFKNVELKRLLWMAASTVEENIYETALRDMAKINPLCVPWLLKHADPQH